MRDLGEQLCGISVSAISLDSALAGRRLAGPEQRERDRSAADAAELSAVVTDDRGKILGETAGVDRFRSKDAYARHNGTAPMPV